MAIRSGLRNGSSRLWEAEDFSAFITDFLVDGIGDLSGDGTDLEVAQQSPLAMAVNVAPGRTYMGVTVSGMNYKERLWNDTSSGLSVSANSSGDNRVDAVIARIDVDSAPDADADNMGTVEIITGTGTSPLTDGYIQSQIGSDSFYRLADITVEDGETQIQNSDIADQRERCSISGFLNVFTDNVLPVISGVNVNGFEFRDDASEVTEKAGNPSTPLTGNWKIFFKSDGMYIIDDAGNATKLFAGGISTSQKAEAAAANGELFENTDDDNRLSWKNAGGTVKDLNYEVLPGRFTKVLNATGNFDQAITTNGIPKRIEIQISGLVANDNAAYPSSNFGVWSTVVFQGSTFKSDKRILGDNLTETKFGNIGVVPLGTLNTYGASPPVTNGHVFVLSLQNFSATGFTIRLANTKTGAPGDATIGITYEVIT